MAYREEEAEGDTLEFAKFLFDRHKPPQGEVIYYDDSFRDIRVYFRALCEIYVYGIKILNGLPYDEPLPEIETLDPITPEFVAQRFTDHLRITPIMTICTPQDQPSWQYGQTLEECVYYDSFRGITLKFIRPTFYASTSYAPASYATSSHRCA